MRKFVLPTTIMVVFSLSACQTVGGLAGIGNSAGDTLYQGIPEDQLPEEAKMPEVDVLAAAKAKADASISFAETEIRASGADPKCGQFNMNSLSHYTRSGTIPGLGILKTMAMGAVSGVAGGAVASIDMGSEFVETAVAGTVNQVIYNGARPVVDKIFPAADNMDALAEIYDAADKINCPRPTWLEAIDKKQAKALLTRLTADFTSSALSKTTNEVSETRIGNGDK